MKNQALLPSPSLFRRLCAMFYDSWLVLGLFFLAGAVLIGLRLILHGQPAEGEHALGGVWQLPTFIAMLLVCAHFFAFFWVRNRQTLAMQAWRIEVVDDYSGKNISWKQAYIRILGAFVSMACFGLGYLWVFIDKDKKSWHDHASGTRLVLLPKRK